MSNVAEVLQRVALLGQGEGLGVAGAQDGHFLAMKLHGLSGGGALHEDSLDLEAHADVAGLDHLLVVGDLLAVHYASLQNGRSD